VGFLWLNSVKMEKINLNIDKEVFNEVYLPYLKTNTRYELFYGGAGSGKSAFVAQKLVLKHMTEKNRKTLIVRKVKSTLRNSVFPEIIYWIKFFNVEDFFVIPSGKGNSIDIEGPNGNKFIFTGLDNVEKLKSISGITDMWIEEATELEQKDFQQLDLRIRGQDANKQFILTFNPTDSNHWIKKFFFDSGIKNATILKTTHLDNKFLDEESRENVEKYINIDATWYNIYALGEWGVLSDLIYNNYEVVDFDNSEKNFDKILVGIDFGFNHPSAMVKVGINRSLFKKTRELYILDNIKKSKLTTRMFGEEILTKIKKSQEIIADSASPGAIEELRQMGLNVKGANKGANSVKSGIDWLKNFRIKIHPECIQTLNEFKTYRWKKNKEDKPIDIPVEVNDDCMDALRYAIEPIRKGMQSKIKKIYY